jgi:flagellin FlaB
MFARKFNNDESGQAALETAIILIAFVVVASVFAFTILSAGSSSTEKGEEAIYAGLEGVQSSMEIKGAVLAEGTTGATPTVDTIVFTVSLVAGGDPVDLTPDDTATTDAVENTVVIGYRDNSQLVNDVPWTIVWIGANDGDNLLEDNELAEITVTLPANIGVNTEFTVEVKPPSGAVLQINRTTPSAIEEFMEFR